MRYSVCALAGAVALAASLTTGCQLGGNNRYSLFGGAYALTDEARGIASSHPEPLAISRELAKKPTGPYIVEPGDVLLVHPANLDSPARITGDQPVLPDGRIQLGVYGMPLVAGKTIDEVEAEVNGLVRLKTRDAGPIVVRLITRDSKVYYVLGEVNSPGVFPLRGRETVLDGIVAAGGLNGSASRHDIILSRPTKPDSCRIVLPVCYPEIVQLGDTTTNYQLRPGDRIFVPTRTFHEWLCPHKHSCVGSCGRQQTACPPPVEHDHGPPPPVGPVQVFPPLPSPEPAPPAADRELPKPQPADGADKPAETPPPADTRKQAAVHVPDPLPWRQLVNAGPLGTR
ncbi:MAG: polysaccharide biosynthesis/export family protein [Gemmataceae bacterium]